MLCNACGELFMFARPDYLLCKKKSAIQDAVKYGYEISHIKSLESDYKRYQQALELSSPATQFPCPWNTGEPPEIPFPVDESFPSQKTRLWREILNSAASTGCGLCERLVAMIQNHATANVDANAEITSVWFMTRGDHTLQWLRFDLRVGGKSVLLIRFHSAVAGIEKSMLPL
jgi:hypothetical protein